MEEQRLYGLNNESSIISYLNEKKFSDLNEKWKDFFKTKVADIIKLYESKLCKDVIRDAFHNPFLLEDNANDEENIKSISLQLAKLNKPVAI